MALTSGKSGYGVALAIFLSSNSTLAASGLSVVCKPAQVKGGSHTGRITGGLALRQLNGGQVRAKGTLNVILAQNGQFVLNEALAVDTPMPKREMKQVVLDAKDEAPMDGSQKKFVKIRIDVSRPSESVAVYRGQKYYMNCRY